MSVTLTNVVNSDVNAMLGYFLAEHQVTYMSVTLKNVVNSHVNATLSYFLAEHQVLTVKRVLNF